MSHEDPAVTMERWTPDSTHEACAETIGAVRAFAEWHGMVPTRVDETAFALADALVPMLDAEGDELTVDAATDGLWLTLRVTGRPGYALLELPVGAASRRDG